jgi:hypothetical protein
MKKLLFILGLFLSVAATAQTHGFVIKPNYALTKPPTFRVLNGKAQDTTGYLILAWSRLDIVIDTGYAVTMSFSVYSDTAHYNSKQPFNPTNIYGLTVPDYTTEYASTQFSSITIPNMINGASTWLAGQLGIITSNKW